MKNLDFPTFRTVIDLPRRWCTSRIFQPANSPMGFSASTSPSNNISRYCPRLGFPICTSAHGRGLTPRWFPISPDSLAVLSKYRAFHLYQIRTRKPFGFPHIRLPVAQKEDYELIFSSLIPNLCWSIADCIIRLEDAALKNLKSDQIFVFLL